MIPWRFGWPSSRRAVYGSAGQCSTVRYMRVTKRRDGEECISKQ